MQELRDAIVDSFNKQVTDGTLQSIVDKMVQECVKRTIEHTLSGWGDFSKQFEKKLSEQLCVGLDRINLHDYNSIIMDEVQARIGAEYVPSAQSNLVKLLNQTFKKPEKNRYALSEIVDRMKMSFQEEAEENRVEECTLLIEKDGNFTRVYLDEEQDKQERECEYEILFYKDKANSISKRDWRGVYALKPEKGRPLTGFDDFLFQLRVWGCEIELEDKEDISLSYNIDG